MSFEAKTSLSVNITGTNEVEVAQALKKLAGLGDEYFVGLPPAYHVDEPTRECSIADPKFELPGNRRAIFRVHRYYTPSGYYFDAEGREVKEVRSATDDYKIDFLSRELNQSVVTNLEEEIRILQKESQQQNSLLGRLARFTDWLNSPTRDLTPEQLVESMVFRDWFPPHV